MSNILKTSGYHLNSRNSVAGNFGDFVKIHRMLEQDPLEDPSSTRWLINFWIDTSSFSLLSGSNIAQIFNWGDAVFAYLVPVGATDFDVWIGYWKRSIMSGEYGFEFWSCGLMQSWTNSWEFWSIALYDVFSDPWSAPLFFRNGASVALAKTPAVGMRIRILPSSWWEFSSSKPVWDPALVAVVPLEVEAGLSAMIADLSIFVKEDLDHTSIIDFLWSSGRGENPENYDTSDGSRLEAHLQMNDGWHLTRRPWIGRNYFDGDGLLATCYFGATPNTSGRVWSFPGGGSRVQSQKSRYLAHTRSDNGFVRKSIPLFDHQYAWIGKSVEVTDFPDADGI